MICHLDRLTGSYAICRLDRGESFPQWAMQGELFSVTRTPTELSAVCATASVPAGVTSDAPWTVLAVRGPLDLNLTGVLAGLATPLADAGISTFAVSTYDTDYLLIRNRDFERAVHVLQQAGHIVADDGNRPYPST